VPTNVAQSGNTANAVTITWTDGAAGTPTERYNVECKIYQASWSSTTMASVTGILRGTQSASVPVNPGTLYTCYVAAYDPAATPAYNPVVSTGIVVSYQNSGTCTGRDLLDPTSYGAPRRCDTAGATREQAEQFEEDQIAVFGKPVSRMTNADIDSNGVLNNFAATVPVCWYLCQATQTLTDSRLAQQLTVMNNAYASAGISFSQLRKLNCRNDRGSGTSSTGYTQWMANLGSNSNIDSGWSYLNSLTSTLGWNDCVTIYSGDWEGTGLLGIAQLGLNTYTMQYNYPTTFPGTGSVSPYNLGATMVHETGHNFSLDHVFNQGCSGLGDGVADTPNGNTNYGCPVGQDSCPSSPGKDAINNFMDYTNDCCMNYFSPQQALAMQANIQSRKPSWVTTPAGSRR